MITVYSGRERYMKHLKMMHTVSVNLAPHEMLNAAIGFIELQLTISLLKTYNPPPDSSELIKQMKVWGVWPE